MNKFLTLMILLFTFSSAAILTTGSGGTYATINLAEAAASAGDTIQLVSDISHTAMVIFDRNRILVRSAPGNTYSCTLNTLTGIINFYAYEADTIRFQNVNILYASGEASGANYIFRTAPEGWGGHRFDNVRFIHLGDDINENKRGCFLTRANGSTVIEPTNFYGCYFQRIYQGIRGNVDSSETATNVTVKKCVFDSTSVNMGQAWKFDSCVFIAGGYENTAMVYAGKIKFSNCWFDQTVSSASGEFITWDGTDVYSHNDTVINCTFVNMGHVFICPDGWHDGIIDGVTMWDTLHGSSSGNVYIHQNETGADTSIHNLTIRNTSFSGRNDIYMLNVANNANDDSSWNINIEKCLFLDSGDIGIWKTHGATIDSSLTEFNTAFDTTVNLGIVFTDTFYNRGSSFLLDDGIWNYHKGNSTFANIGSKKYLSNLGDTSGITENGFSVACSIAVSFRHNNSNYTPSFLSLNSWFTGDTAKVRLMVTADTLSAWSVADSDTVVAGENKTMAAASLTAGTKYWYKTITDGLSNGTTTLHDTTLMDTVRTAGGGASLDTPVVARAAWLCSPTGGGPRIDLIGAKFKAAQGDGYVLVDGAAVTEYWWSDEVVGFIAPAHAAGAVNVIIENSDGMRDTLASAFTYYAAETIDTIYADSSITDSCATYNPATRSCSGGSEQCYRRIQWAVNKMAAGDHILVRAGTYFEKVTLPSAKNGTAWIDGNYNLLKSYSGEWATINGGDTGQKIGAITDGQDSTYDVVGVAFWKIDSLGITGGAEVDNIDAAGISLDIGPFKFTHLKIFNNLSGSAGENPAGIRGYLYDSCIIEYCMFDSNGCLPPIDDINPGHILIFGDYKEHSLYDTGFTYTGPGCSRIRNTIRYNYFGYALNGYHDKNEGILCGRDQADEGYEDDYKYYGVNVHHNYWTTYYRALNVRTDFAQVHHNIFKACSIAITGTAADEATNYRQCFYNNTIYRAPWVVIQVHNTNDHISDVTTPETLSYVYMYNNINDSCRNIDGWDKSIYTVTRPYSSDSYARYDSVHLGNNYTYRYLPYGEDPVGDQIFYLGYSGDEGNRLTLAEYNTRYSRSILHFLQAYDAGNLLYTNSDLKTRNAHTVNGSLTVANGGIGGNHPYLDGVTIPSYIGATGGDTLWVDTVLALISLGDEEDVPQYNLTTSVSGGGSVDPAGTTVHDSAVWFNLTATDGAGYDFVEWEVLTGTIEITDLEDATTTCALHTTGSVRAVFAIKRYTRTTNIICGTGCGTAVLTP